MKPKAIVLAGLIAVLALSSFSLLDVFDQKVDFNTQIKPILNKNCIACHGGVKKTADYSLLFRHEALKPGKSGKPSIVPGDAGASELIRRLTLSDPEERMPLEAAPLKDEEIELLRTWIDQGAEWGNHWAYTRAEKPELPSIGSFWSRLGLVADNATAWIKNEIDYFIADKLTPMGLQPSAEAGKATLLRRVSLDLTGLPPTEAQTARFLADKSPDAYEKLVDSLLATPAYGERWAGMWLDLARYADTKGYERDPGRKIWRYRDWLIKAFNSDKPYNQFVTEQLAGDLLPVAEGDTTWESKLIATGFHRNTMTNDEGGTQDEEFRTAAVIDRVNTTWDVFQGTTFGCVQCHSHPYDPFVHEDYYKYLAFFNNTRDEDVTTDTPKLRFYTGPDSAKVQALSRWVKQHATTPQQAQVRNRELMQLLRVMEPKINSHDFDQYVNASLLDAKYFGFQHGGSARVKQVTMTNKRRLYLAWGTNAPDAVVTFRDGSLSGPVLLELKVPKTGNAWKDSVMIFPFPALSGKHDIHMSVQSPANPKEWTMIKWVSFLETLPGQKPELPDSLDRNIAGLLNAKPDDTPVFWEGSGDLKRKTQVFDRGNWLVKGKEVQPDVPSSLPPLPKQAPKNRLGLAQWMVSREHPLTARVAVNRFWEQLFGTGIVETVEDFGTQGIAPTHRELLDYLAVTFMEDDHWSVKKMLKRMVLSATYRQRSEASADMLEKDPFNRYFARGPRVRLSAEQVRDQALAVSGLLSGKMFGPSVMPPQPDGIWQSPYNGDSWNQSQGDDRYRRALYTYWKRTAPYPSMITFDSPSREFCQLRRLRTNTPLQALVTLNDPVYVEAAEQLACYMLDHGQTPEQRIQSAFRRVMLRDLAPKRLGVLTRLYRTTEAHYRQYPDEARKLLARADATPQQAALTVTANTLLNLDEVITKE
nr:DUF1553 domain-containing protein [uncultured Arsenicibacter sp.]